MTFNSLTFAIFLPIVFLIYWAIGYAKIDDTYKLRLQNAFVILASYIFYGWWDWRFLILIAITSFSSWSSGLLIMCYNNPSGKNHVLSPKFWLWLNIVINLGILGIFKYYDFFASEFGQLFDINTDGLLLRIILPVGISFYTFQALSYTIDVYRQKISATKDFLAFFAFISFFPQLVAGPIERATNLLPQFLQNRRFTYEQGIDGMCQFLWGLFKKIVIADNCALFVDRVWSAYSQESGCALLLAAIFFTFQIYGDFSGYSDMAIGTAKLFDIKLMRNFNNPYFSRDIAEFWRRWHISLTTWFRDYVYIPLGGSRVNKWKVVRNTFIIFIVSGIWHGANWTFLAWGAYHALLFLPLILLGKNRKHMDQVAERKWLPSWKEMTQMLLTFGLVVIGWVIFRAETICQAWDYLGGMAHLETLRAIYWLFLPSESIGPVNFYILAMLIIEWCCRNEEYPLHHLCTKEKPLHLRITGIAFYAIVFFLVLSLRGGDADFIYFQF